MNCKRCGFPLLEDEEVAEICEICFLKRLKELLPHIKFRKADGTETQNPEDAQYIQGIKLRKM